MISPEPDPDPNDGDGNDGGDDEPLPTSLSSMSKSELLDYAEKQGVQGINSKTSKADLIKAIEG